MSAETEATHKKITIPVSSLIWGTLLVIAVAAASYFYWQTRNPEKLSEVQEKKELTETLGEFLDLPTDETPTLATVTDREKLADQPFFLKAENGDKVLIYTNNGKAILYRPSTKKVIDMTTTLVQNPENEVAEQQQAQAPEESVTPEEVAARQDLTVTLLNGGTKSGVTPPIEKKITEELKDYTVEKKDNASKDEYKGILVIDREGSHGERAQELASLLGGQVGPLPEGETATSDIVIIIGN